MHDKAEWWTKWQANEQALATLASDLTGVAFTSSAAVVADIGHHHYGAFALAFLHNLSSRLAEKPNSIEAGNPGVKAMLALLEHEALIE